MSEHTKGQECWLAAWTRARHEKIAARALTGLGLPCWLPLRTEARNYAGVAIHVEVPIIPGCVFIRGDEGAAFQAVMAAGVREVTGIDPNSLAPLPPETRATLLYGERRASTTTTTPPPDETPRIWDGRG